jgi:tetratricopeptide (TPR) repeat protein
VCLLADGPRAAAPVNITDLLDQYEQGGIAAVARAILDIPATPPATRLRVYENDASDVAYVELTRAAPAWIAAAGAEASARRRLIAAAFALELAYLRQGVPWRARYPLIVWSCELLRRQPTRLPAEHWWHLASMAILEDSEDWRHVLGVAKVPMPPTVHPRDVPFINQADREEFIDGHVDHVAQALPTEPRLRLADLHYAEYLTFLPDIEGPLGIGGQQTSSGVLASLEDLLKNRSRASLALQALDPREVKDLLTRVRRIPQIVSRYAALAPEESLRADAELRQGFLRLRLEEWDVALAHLEAVPRSTREAPLVALSHHFRGWIFEQTNRREAAIAAYRDALTAVPRARSVSLLLAAQLTQVGQLDEAYALMDAALKARPAPDRRLITMAASHDAPIDPWLRYKRGDALLLTTFLERLREALR